MAAAQIYHHVLRQSPSPEAAKIATPRPCFISGASSVTQSTARLEIKPWREAAAAQSGNRPGLFVAYRPISILHWERGQASGRIGNSSRCLNIWHLRPVDDVFGALARTSRKNGGRRTGALPSRRDNRGVKSEIDREEILCVAAVLMVGPIRKLADLEKAIFKAFR